MKKCFLILSLTVLFSIVTSAQSIIPRFVSSAAPYDGAFANQGMKEVLTTTPKGTTYIKPNSFRTYLKYTAVDTGAQTLTLDSSRATRSYYGDELFVSIMTDSKSHVLTLSGTYTIGNLPLWNTSTITLTASKHIILYFMFDGKGVRNCIGFGLEF